MIFLKQSTAIDVMLGPFVDDADGKTTEEALSLAQADLQLTKNAGTAAQKNDTASATHIYGGNYKVPLNTTDTGTLGHLRLMCKKSGALPVMRDFMIVPANTYDSLVGGSDYLQVDATQWAGSSTATDDLALKSSLAKGTDITGFNDPSETSIAAAVWDRLTSALTTAGSIGKKLADWILGTDNKVLLSNNAQTGVTIPTVTDVTNLTEADIVDAVWDEAISGHLGAGSTGNALNAAGSAGDPWSTPLPGAYGAGTAGNIIGNNIPAILGYVDTEISAIITHLTDIKGAGWTDETLVAIKGFVDDLETRLTAVRAGYLDNLDTTVSSRLATAGYTAPDNASITAILGYVDTEISTIITHLTDIKGAGWTDETLVAIKGFVDELETRLTAVRAGYLDDIAAIKTKTDNLPSGVKKNTALNNFTFPMISSASGNLTTGLTVTALRSIDGGTPAACANAVTEVGSGSYKIDFAASDLNGDVIMFIFTAPGAKARTFTITTES